MTDEDRKRFISWLEQERYEDTDLADKCDVMGEQDSAKKLRLYAVAADIILDKLKSTEISEVTVGE